MLLLENKVSKVMCYFVAHKVKCKRLEINFYDLCKDKSVIYLLPRIGRLI